MVADVLKTRKQAALQELERLIKDKKAFPINYNHYYTDNVHKKRGKRIEAQLKKHIPENVTVNPARCSLGAHYCAPQTDTKDELERAISRWGDSVSADMEDFSCEESLDCLEAIYKVSTGLLTSPVAPSATQILNVLNIGSTEGLHCQCRDPGH